MRRLYASGFGNETRFVRDRLPSRRRWHGRVSRARHSTAYHNHELDIPAQFKMVKAKPRTSPAIPPASRSAPVQITFQDLTSKRWPDLETLFGPRGASGGCWCMWWRLRRSEYEKRKGAGNKRAFRRIVVSKLPAGVLAYADGTPIGWCAVAPREDYPVLARSRVLALVDEQPVWSLTCFYIARDWRRTGLTTKLIEAAVQYARKRGAKIVEGYPQDPKSGAFPDTFAWTGFASAFRKAGFKEVARRSAGRPVMRKVTS